MKIARRTELLANVNIGALMSRVVDPDPDPDPYWIRIQLEAWIRIQEGKNVPQK